METKSCSRGSQLDGKEGRNQDIQHALAHPKAEAQQSTSNKDIYAEGFTQFEEEERSRETKNKASSLNRARTESIGKPTGAYSSHQST